MNESEDQLRAFVDIFVMRTELWSTGFPDKFNDIGRKETVLNVFPIFSWEHKNMCTSSRESYTKNGKRVGCTEKKLEMISFIGTEKFLCNVTNKFNNEKFSLFGKSINNS